MEPATAITTSSASPATRTSVSRGLILIVGVVLIPMALNIVCNSWGPLTRESAMRMAFATVAGQTVAILSVTVTLAMTALTRRWRQIPLFAVIALSIFMAAAATMGAAAEELSSRLMMIDGVSSPNP